MDDESVESIEWMEEVPLIGGESELERLVYGWGYGVNFRLFRTSSVGKKWNRNVKNSPKTSLKGLENLSADEKEWVDV